MEGGRGQIKYLNIIQQLKGLACHLSMCSLSYLCQSLINLNTRLTFNDYLKLYIIYNHSQEGKVGLVPPGFKTLVILSFCGVWSL